MRSSDWSSDVRYSDLDAEQELRLGGGEPVGKHRQGNGGIGLRNDVEHEDRPRQPVGAVDRWIDLAGRPAADRGAVERDRGILNRIGGVERGRNGARVDRKSTRLNSSH